jgi:glutathione S-transferase
MMVALLGRIEWTDEVVADVMKHRDREAARFSSVYLQDGPFIAGSTPTIADLFAYTEIAQVPQVLGSDFDFDASTHGELKEWLARMKELPHHEDVHRTTYKLGAMFQDQVLGKK